MWTPKLVIPGTDTVLVPGNIVKLHRFDNDSWTVNYGWFSYSGNRPFCGWFLTGYNGYVKPLQLPDLDDIYLIATDHTCHCNLGGEMK